MAYVTNESGTPEVYVQAYPGPGEKIRISTAGGVDPMWSVETAASCCTERRT